MYMGRSYDSSCTDEVSDDCPSSCDDFRALLRQCQSPLSDTLTSSSDIDSSSFSQDSWTERKRGWGDNFNARRRNSLRQHGQIHQQNGGLLNFPTEQKKWRGRVTSNPKRIKKMASREVQSSHSTCSFHTSGSSTRSNYSSSSYSSISDNSEKGYINPRLQPTQDSEAPAHGSQRSDSSSLNSTKGSPQSSSSHGLSREEYVHEKICAASHQISSTSSPANSGEVEEGSNSSERTNPVGISSEIEKELLQKVDENLGAVAYELYSLDAQLEERMNKNQFERLYVFNNRSIRESRDALFNEFCKLRAMREELVSGAFKKAIIEQREHDLRLKKLYSEDGVFARLYNKRQKKNIVESSSFTRKPAAPASEGKAQKDSNRYGNMPTLSSAKSRLACHANLYARGMAMIKRRKEKEEVASRQHQRREIEEYLGGILSARLRAEDYQKSKRKELSGENISKLVEEKIRCGVESPDVIKAVLKEKKSLKERELTEKLNSLYKQRGRSKAVLEERRIAAELKECTFHPRINRASSRLQSNLDNDTRLWLERKKNLYAHSIRQKKMVLLRARMQEDHHFRDRVERDPSIGEAFMSSVYV